MLGQNTTAANQVTARLHKVKGQGLVLNRW
ncbi:hypothetical protein E2C01_061173 [Portunus trituberculatus]|uniref:Uncharacterized protein n=1 Tax=Portunus trituberculatus TaxID=210409 RepID=A0A5B7HA11_PORTR|nr:hypothetical protein [Portunus trituberculatus]